MTISKRITKESEETRRKERKDSELIFEGIEMKKRGECSGRIKINKYKK